MSKRVKPLDIVRTPKGAIALVTECDGTQASIDRFPHQKETYEKTAWWDLEDLHVLGGLPQMLANATAHNCGSNQEQGDRFFGAKREQE